MLHQNGRTPTDVIAFSGIHHSKRSSDHQAARPPRALTGLGISCIGIDSRYPNSTQIPASTFPVRDDATVAASEALPLDCGGRVRPTHSYASRAPLTSWTASASDLRQTPTTYRPECCGLHDLAEISSNSSGATLHESAVGVEENRRSVTHICARYAILFVRRWRTVDFLDLATI